MKSICTYDKETILNPQLKIPTSFDDIRGMSKALYKAIKKKDSNKWQRWQPDHQFEDAARSSLSVWHSQLYCLLTTPLEQNKKKKKKISTVAISGFFPFSEEPTNHTIAKKTHNLHGWNTPTY